MQEIKSCPLKYFLYLESKVSCLVTQSAWKYSCFELNRHKGKKNSNFKDYRYLWQRFQQVATWALVFCFRNTF